MTKNYIRDHRGVRWCVAHDGTDLGTVSVRIWFRGLWYCDTNFLLGLRRQYHYRTSLSDCIRLSAGHCVVDQHICNVPGRTVSQQYCRNIHYYKHDPCWNACSNTGRVSHLGTDMGLSTYLFSGHVEHFWSSIGFSVWDAVHLVSDRSPRLHWRRSAAGLARKSYLLPPSDQRKINAQPHESQKIWGSHRSGGSLWSYQPFSKYWKSL